MLKKYNMSDCNGVDTPLDPGTARAMMLLPTDKVDAKVAKEYQGLIGELIWLLKTRPDLQFTISFLSRFLKCATQAHLDFARGRPLRFLKQTANYGIVFAPGNGEWTLSGASDSDLAGDLLTARSTLGYYAKLGEFGTILSGCGLDRKISTSTGQAETYAMQSLIKDVVWLRTLLTELSYPMPGPTPLFTDNDGVLKQSTKAVNHTSAKHYRIAQAYIRQNVLDLVVKVLGINTKDNGSDIYTKALHAPSFLIHQRTIMGPQSPPDDK
jgi:hypothetical protein